MVRPKSKYNPSTYTFKLWESNKLELDRIKPGNKSSTINEALQNHFKIKNKVDSEIIFQMEEHKKIIDQHQRCYNNLEDELGKRREKERIELENKKKIEEEKEEDIKQKYDTFTRIIKEWGGINNTILHQTISTNWRTI